MKAAVLKKYNFIDWEEVPDPEVNDTDVLIRNRFGSICGSDQHVFAGDFQQRTHLPLIIGHEFTGIVEDHGSKVHNVTRGERVVIDPIVWCGSCEACKRGHFPACINLKLLGIDRDGGFAEYISVPEKMLFKLPPVITDQHATLVEVLSIGFHACNRAEVGEDDDILIWGAGKLGQSILQAVKTRTSGKVFLVDIIYNRLEMAKNTYNEIITINSAIDDPVEVIKEHTNGVGVDVAFEAVGHATNVPGRLHPVRSSIRSIRSGGKVIVLGLSGEPAPVLMQELIYKEGIIITSRVSHGEFAETIIQLEQNNLNPEILISEILPASKISDAFHKLNQAPENYLKILLEIT